MALRVKRPLDLDGLHDALPLSCAHRTPVKRMKPDVPANFSPQNGQAPSQAVHASPRNVNFHVQPVEEGVLDELLGECSDGLGIRQEMSDVNRSGGWSGGAERDEKLYTEDEVKQIVHKAVAAREEALCVVYDGILQEKLNEQFQSFTKFNKDYISRQFTSNPFSYVS